MNIPVVSLIQSAFTLSVVTLVTSPRLNTTKTQDTPLDCGKGVGLEIHEREFKVNVHVSSEYNDSQ
jgi:hypothetical protein